MQCTIYHATYKQTLNTYFFIEIMTLIFTDIYITVNIDAVITNNLIVGLCKRALALSSERAKPLL